VRGPYGLHGGESGAPGKNLLVHGRRTVTIPGKARFEVEAGDVLHIESPGGGGYGQAKVKLQPVTARAPQPVTRVAMLQTWRRLTFLHWPYEPLWFSRSFRPDSCSIPSTARLGSD